MPEPVWLKYKRRNRRDDSQLSSHHSGERMTIDRNSVSSALLNELISLHLKPYPTLRSLRGRSFPIFTTGQGSIASFQLHYPQQDPHAAPSAILLKVPFSFSSNLICSTIRQTACEDFLLRRFVLKLSEQSVCKFTIAKPSQHVLSRDALRIIVNENSIEVRMSVHLPAIPVRKIDGQSCCRSFQSLIRIAKRILSSEEWDTSELTQLDAHVDSVDAQEWLRQQLADAGLVAFVHDGAILARTAGDNDLPMSQESVSFQSPPSLRVHFDLPEPLCSSPHLQSRICGMGIRTGVTTIVGGGYHGKSTLLRALQVGVYNHICEDGREFVVTDPTAITLRAEDRRSVVSVNISPFLTNLPGSPVAASGLPRTQDFISSDASGSTSQSANLVEALSCGATVLLLDEDTSATNWMTRDSLMASLITSDNEPIQPFSTLVRDLWESHGISTILVTGGSSHFLDKSDTVIAAMSYHMHDITQEVYKLIYRSDCQSDSLPSQKLGVSFDNWMARNIHLQKSIRIRGRVKCDFGLRQIQVTDDLLVDVGCVEQFVEQGQGIAAAVALRYLTNHSNGWTNVNQLVSQLRNCLQVGLVSMLEDPQGPWGTMTEPRPYEIMATLFRVRSLVSSSLRKV